MSLPAGSAAAAGAFRTTFHFTENVNWFPGHMLKSMRELGDRLKMCHAVLEVRDARVRRTALRPTTHQHCVKQISHVD